MPTGARWGYLWPRPAQSPMPTSPAARILVIKLSALGDFVLSIGSFQAIRKHHADAHITLLTTRPFVRLAEASGCFDEVWVDPRAPWWRIGAWIALIRRLRGAGFERVYDLQRSQRTAWYFRLCGVPEWVGTVAGCSHRYVPPAERALHITERETAQLERAGVGSVAPPDLSFIEADARRFELPPAYALLVPGSAPHRPGKRWPAERYAELAAALAEGGMTPVLIGGAAERAVLGAIFEHCPAARNLCGRTDLFDIVSLARAARVAVANDTGPAHLIAAAGCPIVVLFSADSDPGKSGPPWPNARVLRQASLAEVSTKTVLGLVREIERPE